MSTYLLGFQEIDKTKHEMVGGKAANQEVEDPDKIGKLICKIRMVIERIHIPKDIADRN